MHGNMIGGIEIDSAKKEKVERQREEALKRLKDLENQIEVVGVRNEKLDSQMLPVDDGDWTKSYSYWSRWEDLEDLNFKKETEAKKVESLGSRPDFMGHYHDHSEERKLFLKPEKEKLQHCENYRCMGNYLFQEGIYPKAAEQYQIALSFYEYCFPEDPKDIADLDNLRHACLCNISFCYNHMGLFREACESASRVLEEDEGNAKAWFRRAVAKRGLDDFRGAAIDISRARELRAEDSRIVHEMKVIASQQRLCAKLEQEMASHMWSNANPSLFPATPSAVAGDRDPNLTAAAAQYWSRAFDCEKHLEPACVRGVCGVSNIVVGGKTGEEGSVR